MYLKRELRPKLFSIYCVRKSSTRNTNNRYLKVKCLSVTHRVLHVYVTSAAYRVCCPDLSLGRLPVTPFLWNSFSINPLWLKVNAPDEFHFLFHRNRILLFHFFLQDGVVSFVPVVLLHNHTSQSLPTGPFHTSFMIHSFTSVNQINFLCLNLCWVSNDHLFYNTCFVIAIRLLNLFCRVSWLNFLCTEMISDDQTRFIFLITTPAMQ